MLHQWTRYFLWRPFELGCRRYPLVPLRSTVTEPVAGVMRIRIDNVLTRLLSRFAGGYDYAVCYLVGGSLLVDTGFPWARRSLRKVLLRVGADRSLRSVVNTHYHEDHVGNNDLLAEISNAKILAHPVSLSEIRFPSELPWYRHFLFGPSPAVEVEPIGISVDAGSLRFDVLDTPGHCPGHICLFERQRRWLFSGDLYVAGDLDSQLADADGPAWIRSLDRVISLKPKCLFDAHGTVLTDEADVQELLTQKRDFLCELRQRIVRCADRAQSVREITRRVFDRRSLVNHVSFSNGWLSLITASDFSRAHLVKSFLPGCRKTSDASRSGPVAPSRLGQSSTRFPRDLATRNRERQTPARARGPSS